MAMKKLALVTGGNRGIGYYLAKELAQDGYDLVIVGRDRQRLIQASCNLSKHGADVMTLVEDLSDPEAPNRIFELLKERKLNVDVLVNNAGFGSFGSFVNKDITNELNMIDVNIKSLVHLTHLMANEMRVQGGGAILNVASVAGFQAGPFMNTYFASKNFVLSFTEALAYELKPYDIKVTALCPGSTSTDFFNRAQVNRKADAFKNRMSPAKVAKIGYRALKRGKVICVPGLGNKALIQLQRGLPRKLVTTILGYSMGEKE